MIWLKQGGLDVDALSKFGVPYSVPHLGLMIRLNRSETVLTAAQLRRMQDPYWFNMLCAALIRSKNFILRIDSLQLFSNNLEEYKPINHSRVVAVKYTELMVRIEFMISEDGGEFYSSFDNPAKLKTLL